MTTEKKVHVGLYTPKDFAKKIKEEAKREGRSVSGQVIHIVMKHWGKK